MPGRPAVSELTPLGKLCPFGWRVWHQGRMRISALPAAAAAGLLTCSLAFAADPNVAADQPGSIQRTIWVAATGEPVVLKDTQSGPPKRGGEPIKACHEDLGLLSPRHQQDGTTIYTRLNQPVNIEKPKRAQPFPK